MKFFFSQYYKFVDYQTITDVLVNLFPQVGRRNPKGWRFSSSSQPLRCDSVRWSTDVQYEFSVYYMSNIGTIKSKWILTFNNKFFSSLCIVTFMIHNYLHGAMIIYEDFIEEYLYLLAVGCSFRFSDFSVIWKY